MSHGLRSLTVFLALVGATVGALAATQQQGTRINFQANAQRSAPNDLGSAAAYIELSGPSSADIAQRVNVIMADALAMAKEHAKVTVRSGNSRTWPIYGSKPKNGQSPVIEGWRMRSELHLESRDAAALGALVGQLQATLAVSDIGFAPSPESRRKVEDDTALDAIRTFREKAGRYAGALKRPYRIRSLNIHGGAVPPAPTFRAMASATADSAPMPIEAGESIIQITVEGQIELVESTK